MAHGQTINLPPGKYDRIYLLAAAISGDQKATFRVGGHATDLTIQEWTGFIGQWDDRIWKTTEEQFSNDRVRRRHRQEHAQNAHQSVWRDDRNSTRLY